MNSKKLKFTCELLTFVITLEFVGLKIIFG